MPSSREDGERPAKRRATMSCDRCKSRKTKCVDPVPGPCQFCASINAPCHLDSSRRKQRPYYRVSEEEFRCMRQVLEHLLPNTELNLESLRAYVASLDSIPVPAPLTPSASEATFSSYALPNPPTVVVDPADDDVSITDEMSELHNELGKMRLDPRGVPRYVAPGSAYLFHSTVRSMKDPRPPAPFKSEILAPLTASHVPSPPTSGSPLGAKRAPFQVNLPRRELCNQCIARFFRDINSVYWLFSSEHLHSILDRLYSGDASCATPATLCALYSILALTCESEMQQEWSDSAARPSVTYLTLAKALTPALYDDADSDSIRALCLLGLVLSASMCVNTAYVYVGAAVRMAFTLGWHAREDFKSLHEMGEQVDLRLFCTLYTLDLDMSLTFGSPTAVGRGMINTPKAPSEQLLGPGSHMPLEYLDTSCQLAHIRRGLTSLLYRRPSANSPQMHVSSVSQAISSLEEWYLTMPSHLRDPTKVARFHERSVGVLHLRYWNAVIYATRPFLLYSAWKRDEATPNPKQKWFEEFGAKCITAAQKSLEVIEFLKDRNLLSSLVNLDCGCILDNMQVFLLALLFSDPLVHKQNLVACLRALQTMEPVFWTRNALAEVTAQLQERGILNQEQELDLGNDSCPGLIFLEFAQQGENTFYSDFSIPDLQAMLSRSEDASDVTYGL